MKQKQVTLRLPQEVISRVAKVAKMAGVSPTQVYNVFLAATVLGLDKPRDAASNGGNKE